MSLTPQPRSFRDKRRGSAGSRGYGGKWAAAAAEFKRQCPWCMGCLAIGKQVASEVVDHIEPHRGNFSKFWNRRNWQPSCVWHHSAVKPTLERRWECAEITVDQLRLDSVAAIALTKAKKKPAIGTDGWEDLGG